MSRSWLQLIQKLNNDGVALMQNARYQEANVAFAKSLGIAKKKLQHFERTEKDHLPFSSSRCLYATDFEYDMVDLQNQPLFNSFVFCTPLKIVRMLELEVVGCSDCFSKLSFVIVFNLALSHHLGAMSNGDPLKREDLLRKSLRLYEVAHEIHGKEYCNQTHFEIIMVINNIAEIQREVRNESKAQKCYEQLLEMIMFLLVDQGYEESGNGMMKQLDGVIFNVQQIVLKKIMVAPAA
jgi:tetratricopeptide (TPR) repeat protein